MHKTIFYSLVLLVFIFLGCKKNTRAITKIPSIQFNISATTFINGQFIKMDSMHKQAERSERIHIINIKNNNFDSIHVFMTAYILDSIEILSPNTFYYYSKNGRIESSSILCGFISNEKKIAKGENCDFLVEVLPSVGREGFWTGCNYFFMTDSAGIKKQIGIQIRSDSLSYKLPTVVE